MNERSIPQKCIRIRNDIRISLAQGRCKLVFENEMRRDIQEVQVDGCAIEAGPRCDYLIIDTGGKISEHYVELKGCDVTYALEQVIATINQISIDSRRLLKCVWIICTRYPKEDSKIKRLKRIIKKENNSLVVVKTFAYTVRLE